MQFLDKYGWPVERIEGRPITNVIRLLLHTRKIVRKLEPSTTDANARVDTLLAENRLLSAIREKAQILLLVSIKSNNGDDGFDSGRVNMAMGELNLACKAYYDWNTERCMASQRTEAF